MIAKIIPRQRAHGASTTASARRLMVYLLGPGDAKTADGVEPGCKGNAHTSPRVVAAWDRSALREWRAACAEAGSGDVAAAEGRLRAVAVDVADAASRVLVADRGSGDRNLVWHAVLAAHPDDGVLADAAWDAVARRLLDETGLHPQDGDNPVRWVAVRHGVNGAGADHVHVMAVLVRADGTRAGVHNDAFAAQRAARWAESEFGLVPGRGRTHPGPDGPPRHRVDGAPGRGEAAAAAKAGDRYPRPAGMPEDVWARVRAEGLARGWTRQGRARAAVLSAAARAVSMEHLVALLAEQGYTAAMRYSTVDPGRVTGWSVVAPPDRPGQSPKAYPGKRLGPECTWPALAKHLAARGPLVGGRLAVGEGEAMLTTEAMAAAGWGPGFIDRVLAADASLADGTGDTAEGYWLRDAVWQVAWQLEGSRGEHGPWTDAAYLYAAAAAGGVPRPPSGVAESLAQLRAWIAAAEDRRGELWAASRERDTQAAGVRAAVRAADARAAGSAGRARAHLPYDLLAAPSASVSRAGTAWVAVSLARLDLRTHAAVVSHAATVRAAGTARLGALTAEAGAAAGEASHLREWLDAARGHEAALLAAQARYEDAASEWRAAVGRLLAEARAASDAGAEARVAGMDARYGPAPAPRPPAEVVAAGGGRA